MKRLLYVFCAFTIVLTMMLFGKPYQRPERAYAPGVTDDVYHSAR